MNSIIVKLQNWIHHALHEEEGWPQEPLNRGMLLLLLYSAPPAGIAWATFEIAGWDRWFPLWLSPYLIICGAALAWFAIDEWSSRRRSEDGEGHGWIIQMVQRFWPKRWTNRVALCIIGLAFVISSGVAYVDRFVANGLQGSRYTVVTELLLAIPLNVWAVVVIVRSEMAQTDQSSSITYRIWRATGRILVAVALINALITVGDRLRIQTAVPMFLAIVVFGVGVGVEALANKLRRRQPADSTEPEPSTGPPIWW